VEALAVVRESLQVYLLAAVEDLSWKLLARTADLDDAWVRLDLARALLRDIDADDDVEVHLGRRRGRALAEALRANLDVERDMAAERASARAQRGSGGDDRARAVGDRGLIQLARLSTRRTRSATPRNNAA
jgi:hypothetical protein